MTSTPDNDFPEPTPMLEAIKHEAREGALREAIAECDAAMDAVPPGDTLMRAGIFRAKTRILCLLWGMPHA